MNGSQREHCPEFTLRILIRHPDLDPDDITRGLEIHPNMSNKIGDKKRSPDGTLLKGTHRVVTWSHWLTIAGKRAFFKAALEMLDKLESRRIFLNSLTETGGQIDMIFDLCGDVNIGDSVGWNDLGRLVALKINLGIEVFP